MRSWYHKLFDRLNRYRIAAVFLSAPTAYILITDQHFVGHDLELLVRISFRTGLVILLIAIAIDWWDVYRGRRKIKKMVAQKIKDGD